METFKFTTAEAGLIATAALIASAAGGLLFGMAADYFGPTRLILMWKAGCGATPPKSYGLRRGSPA